MTVSFVWNSLWSAFAHVSWKKNKQAESRVFCAESVQNNSPNEIQRKFMQYVQCVCEYMVLMYCWLDLCHAYLWDCFQPTPCSILLHPPPPQPPIPHPVPSPIFMKQSVYTQSMMAVIWFTGLSKRNPEYFSFFRQRHYKSVPLMMLLSSCSYFWVLFWVFSSPSPSPPILNSLSFSIWNR